MHREGPNVLLLLSFFLKLVVIPAADSLPLAGQWSRWTGYSACSVTCGGGEQQKTRLCDNPPPYGGGADCVGRDRATRPCAEWDCPGSVQQS